MSPASSPNPRSPISAWSCQQPGFLDALQDLCRKTGTLLVIDETHTISTGYGGYTRTHNLKPDFLDARQTGRGWPATAVFGCTAEIAERMRPAEEEAGSGYSGMGTTLSANALQFKAMRANLEHVMTPAAYDHMLPLSEKLARGIEGEIKQAQHSRGMSRMSAPVPSSSARRSAAQWDRGAGGDAWAGGTRRPPLSAQSRAADRTLPQHDAGEPGHDPGAGGSPGGNHRPMSG